MSIPEELRQIAVQSEIQRDRLILLEKILVMALMASPDRTLSIPPELAEQAEKFAGGFDISKGTIRLVDVNRFDGSIPDGISIRMYARTTTEEDF